MFANALPHQGAGVELPAATGASGFLQRCRVRWLLLAVGTLWLSACAPLAPEPPAQPEPETAESVEAPLPPALLALVDRAAQFTAAGDYDDAAAALERALRLSPEDPGLWHRLAAVRLAQGDWEAAEAMAQRSLERDDTGVWRRANWRLIAEARRQAGDRDGAREAEARLRAG